MKQDTKMKTYTLSKAKTVAQSETLLAVTQHEAIRFGSIRACQEM